MPNTIIARIEFSFKGEAYQYETLLDLDEMMSKGAKIPDLTLILAKQNNVDTYSYLYEVMESSEISFSDATGLASDCVVDSRFDMQKFEPLWLRQRAMDELRGIATKTMSIDFPEETPGLMDALFEAYQLGKTEIQS